MHICVIGTGYVGLVTGTCFAEFGNDVTCVDIDEKKIDDLKQVKLPIYEPGLDTLVAKNLKEGRLTFTTDFKQATDNSLVVFIAVGTPQKDDGSADMRFVESVAKELAKHLKGYKVLVNKSTVPVGSGEWLQGVVEQNLTHECKISVVSNPEFLREGSAIEDFMRPNRVVIGAQSSEAIAIMKELYSPLYLIETPFIITDLKSAELIKYASNAFLATKISFINEIANFCDIVGADVHHVAAGMGLDNRIGRKFLHAGPGYGGSCFPKDTSALIAVGKKNGFNFNILNSVVAVNEKQASVAFEKIKLLLGTLEGKTIGVLGLSFKPNTDDMRDAPSVKIVEAVIDAGASVKAFDPIAMDNAREMLPDVHYCGDTYEVADGSDALVFVTEWNQFRSLDLEKIKDAMKAPNIIDLRNIYDPDKMAMKGFKYTSIGRASTTG